MKINRKPKKSNSASKLVLEQIIGLTTKNANGLASNLSTGECVYLAGCVVVVYNVESGTQSHLMVSSRMPKPLSCVAVSQDGRYIAAGESGNQPAVLVWESSSQVSLSELKGHRYGVTCIAFSPDGKHLVSVGFQNDGYLCVWDWRSGRLVTKFKASSSNSAVSSVCFSSDANFLVTAGKNHLKFWMIGSSTRSQTNVWTCFLTMDGKPANVGCQKGSLFISIASSSWVTSSDVNYDRADEFYPIYALTDAGVLCLLHSGFSVRKWVDLQVKKGFALSVSNKLIACACSNGTIQLFSVGTLKYAGSLQYSESKESHVTKDIVTKSHEEGSKLASSSPDAIACQFSTTEKLVVIYGDHSLCIWDVCDVEKVTRCCVLVSHSGCIWDVKNLTCEYMHDPAFACVARGCGGGVSFATCSKDGTIRLWDLALLFDSSHKIKPELAMNQDICCSSSNSETKGTINLVSAGIFERDIVESGLSIQGFRSMAVSSDGKHLAAGDFRGNLHIYNLHTSDYTCIQEAHDAEILTLSFSFQKNFNSGQEVGENYYLLASGGRDRIIHLYDVKRGYELIESLDDHSAAVTSVNLSCSSCKILSCSADRSLVFRDVAVTDVGCKISHRHQLTASHGTVYDMAVDPTTEVAVTVGQDKKINTFDIASRKLIRTFKHDGDFGEPIKVTMDPSSSYLVCSYSNKSICIYDFTSGELVTKAVGHSEVITGVIFLPDCKHIISVSGDGCIFVWKLPALLSSKILQKVKELTGPLSPTRMTQLVTCESYKIKSKDVLLMDNSTQIGQIDFYQENGSQEVSTYRFSISRLPKWAQSKVLNKEAVVAKSDSSLIQQQDFPSSDAVRSGKHTPMHLEIDIPSTHNMGSSMLRLPNISQDSFDTDCSRNSSVSQEISSTFTMDNRWRTIHTVCMDLMDSPAVKDCKETKVSTSAHNLLSGPTMERKNNAEDIKIALDCGVAEHLLVEPSCSTSKHFDDDGKDLTLSEQEKSSVLCNMYKNEDQPGIKKTCFVAVENEVSAQKLHSDACEVLATIDSENSYMIFQDDDLFTQHFGNLSTPLKLEGRKSSARKRYSSRFVLRRDHLTGFQKLFNTPIRNSGGAALNCLAEVAPDISLTDQPIQQLEEQQLSDTHKQDVKDSTESLLVRNCTLRQSDLDSCLVADNLANTEGKEEEDRRVAVPGGAEINERITECSEALLTLDAAASSVLRLFSEFGILVSKEDASSGSRDELYDQAAELLPLISEKVHAVSNLVQSSKQDSSANTREELSAFEPLLGKFAESLSHQVLEIVKKNL